MKEVCVVKYGGSFLIPNNEYDVEAITFLIDLVKAFPKKKFVFIIGGGGLARNLYKTAGEQVRKVIPEHLKAYALDELGIAATKINASVVLQLMTEILGPKIVDQRICIDPEAPLKLRHQVTLAAGGHPGHTTDYDMMQIAKNAAADEVYKISNFDHVLRVHPDDFNPEGHYPEISEMTWEELRKLVGTHYVSGGHYPLDPRAVILGEQLAKKSDFKLYIGKKEQLPAMLAGEEFIGTLVTSSFSETEDL